MPPREWRFRVQDMLHAIESILSYTQGMDFAAFDHDQRTVDAVVRNLIVIGEAANRIPDEVLLVSTDIPWTEMRTMRNFVVHEYFGVSTRILWDTVQVNLPPLVAPLRRLAGQAPE